MTILPILVYPHEGLTKPSLPVPPELITSDQVQKLIHDMTETLYASFGIGLAAPQVGHLLQIVLVDVPSELHTKSRLYVMINPEIVGTMSSSCTQPEREGCLSVPNVYESVMRPGSVKVDYLDQNGYAMQLEADGLLARAIHHEVDHLQGKVFIDKLSRLKRNLALKKGLTPKYPIVRAGQKSKVLPLSLELVHGT